MKQIKWIFFDIGYTLVNEDGAHHTRNLDIIRTLERQNTVISEHTLMRQVYAEIERGRRGPYQAAANAFGSTQKHRYVRAHEAPYPAAAGLLSALHNRYRLGIIASQSGGTVERLRRYRLFDELDLVFSSEEIGLDKPNPEFFRAACRSAGCLPAEAAMVGDRLDNDIFPAKAIGMYTVRVRQGHFRLIEPPDAAHTPDATVDSIADAARIFLP